MALTRPKAAQPASDVTYKAMASSISTDMTSRRNQIARLTPGSRWVWPIRAMAAPMSTEMMPREATIMLMNKRNGGTRG